MSSPAAESVWSAADAALGEPVSRLAWEGPSDQLDRTENAQPALLAASIAILEALRARWVAAGLEPPGLDPGHPPRPPGPAPFTLPPPRPTWGGGQEKFRGVGLQN